MAEFFLICSSCQQRVEVLDEWRGMSVACPYCGGAISVPPPDPLGEDSVDIGVHMPETPAPQTSPENQSTPLYFQTTDAAEERKSSRRRRTAVNIIIKTVFSIILLAVLAVGAWYGSKKYFYVRSGFHEIASVDGVSLLSSGHGFYLEAKKLGQDYSGNVSYEDKDGKYWITIEFKDGKAHGDALIYKNKDEVRARLTFEHGKLIRVIAKNGKEALVRYDFFGRPEALSLDGDFLFRKGVSWVCDYSTTGMPEKVVCSYENGNRELQCTFNDFYFPHEIVGSKDGKSLGRVSLQYDAEEKLKSVTEYDRNGRKKQQNSTNTEMRGAGPMHIFFFRL